MQYTRWRSVSYPSLAGEVLAVVQVPENIFDFRHAESDVSSKRIDCHTLEERLVSISLMPANVVCTATSHPLYYRATSVKR